MHYPDGIHAKYVGSWMNPEHLATFLAVTRHMNFTRAAEERFLSQPAVSRQVKQLSARLGVPLFEQVGRSVELTDAGRTLVPLAEELLGDMERVSEAVQRHRLAGSGRLRIGASSTPGTWLLPPVLGRFHQAWPDVELQYTVHNSRTIERQLVRNELDLGFMGRSPSLAELEATPLIDDEIAVFCGPEHPLAKERSVGPDALGDMLWVTRERGSATRQTFEAWLERVGGTMERTIELSSTEAIKAMVGSGVGISFMSRLGLARELRHGTLRQVAVAGLDLVRPIYRVQHGRKHLSPVMSAFLALLDS
jgi:LysR family transcriptional regulator, low CO2-responsive transcriptional regulator